MNHKTTARSVNKTGCSKVLPCTIPSEGNAFAVAQGTGNPATKAQDDNIITTIPATNHFKVNKACSEFLNR
jgi:hypothetical protein